MRKFKIKVCFAIILALMFILNTVSAFAANGTFAKVDIPDGGEPKYTRADVQLITGAPRVFTN